MSLVAKLALVVLSLALAGQAAAREVVILAVGGAEAANCNEQRFGPVPGVFQLGADGSVVPARDPLLRSDCDGGSVWMPLASRMIERGLATRVVLVPVAVRQAGAAVWKQGGEGHKRLADVLAHAKKSGLRFDYMLWQGGPLATAKNAEYLALRQVIRYISLNVRVGKILVALDSGGSPEHQVARVAQKDNGSVSFLRRFLGPDLDTLGPGLRRADRSLSAVGQETLADMWLGAIVDAERRSKEHLRESLVPFFQ